MTTDLARHRAELERLGRPAVERFVARHHAYALDGEPEPLPSVTNYCLPGWRGHERAIFKFFCTRERFQRELYGLRHWADTGLVPEVFAEDGERLLVMSHVRGTFLPSPEEPGFAEIDRHTVGVSLGQAVARFIHTPLQAKEADRFEARFYGRGSAKPGRTLDAYLRGVISSAMAVRQRAPCYQAPAFGASLSTMIHALPVWRSQPRILFHQDALNVHFRHSRLMGFFDLEMCRVGCEAMQIGAVWELLAHYRAWAHFCEGFAHSTDRHLTDEDREAARAFAHFLVWRYITRYGAWHGNGLDDAGWAREREAAAGYLEMLERIESVR